jgi:outer membrane protein OmpA-like peptidoglycan-associated protein
MKKVLYVIALFFMVPFAAGAQEKPVLSKALGVNFFFNDFVTPDRIRTTSLNQVLADKRFARMREMTSGLAVTYMKGLRPHLDMSASLGGSFLRYPMPGKNFTNNSLLLEANANMHFKMTTEEYWVQPYLIAGLSVHKYRSYYGATLPLGMGLKVNLLDEAHLILSSTYRVPVTTETANYHFQHSIGIVGSLLKKKKPEVKVPEVVVPTPPADTDKDGIIDAQDKCPTVPGLAKYQGCPIPDTDKDGINDEQDKCPNVPGLARYNGCPIPDSDGDGINDEEDKCPKVPGVARYNGCPIPDTDGDGLNDEVDKCPKDKGSVANNGCPLLEEITEIKFDFRKVQFLTGSAALTKTAKVELDKAAQIMTKYPDIKVSVEGHTDNTGSAAMNQTLSEKRAAAVKAYIVAKGVSADRLQAKGFGPTKPVATNKTTAGRAMNRRVEFKSAN